MHTNVDKTSCQIYLYICEFCVSRPKRSEVSEHVQFPAPSGVGTPFDQAAALDGLAVTLATVRDHIVTWSQRERGWMRGRDEGWDLNGAVRERWIYGQAPGMFLKQK